MAKLTDWDGYAKTFNGAVVVWINQAEAKNLKAVNSQGVCNAVVKDWIRSFRSYSSDRQDFLQRFTKRDASGAPLDAYVPDEYIEQQKELSNELKVNHVGLALRQKAFAELQKKGDAQGAKNAAKELWDFTQHAIGGVDCEGLVTRRSLADAISFMRDRLAGKAGYMALTLTGPSKFSLWEFGWKRFGHVVGIEMRPSLKLFEFLDANSGLFAFTQLDDLLGFIERAVWPRFYQSQPITIYAMYLYGTGHGGFITLAEDLDQMMAEFARTIGSLPPQTSPDAPQDSGEGSSSEQADKATEETAT